MSAAPGTVLVGRNPATRVTILIPIGEGRCAFAELTPTEAREIAAMMVEEARLAEAALSGGPVPQSGRVC